jgi:hypothetical protein
MQQQSSKRLRLDQLIGLKPVGNGLDGRFGGRFGHVARSISVWNLRACDDQSASLAGITIQLAGHSNTWLVHSRSLNWILCASFTIRCWRWRRPGYELEPMDR